jgi:hypothetical protein
MNRPVSQHERASLLLYPSAAGAEQTRHIRLEELALGISHPIVDRPNEGAQHVRSARGAIGVRLTGEVRGQLHRAELVIGGVGPLEELNRIKFGEALKA